MQNKELGGIWNETMAVEKSAESGEYGRISLRLSNEEPNHSCFLPGHIMSKLHIERTFS